MKESRMEEEKQEESLAPASVPVSMSNAEPGGRLSLRGAEAESKQATEEESGKMAVQLAAEARLMVLAQLGRLRLFVSEEQAVRPRDLHAILAAAGGSHGEAVSILEHLNSTGELYKNVEELVRAVERGRTEQKRKLLNTQAVAELTAAMNHRSVPEAQKGQLGEGDKQRVEILAKWTASAQAQEINAKIEALKELDLKDVERLVQFCKFVFQR